MATGGSSVITTPAHTIVSFAHGTPTTIVIQQTTVVAEHVSSADGISKAMMIGVVFGSIVLLSLLLGAGVFWWRRKQQRGIGSQKTHIHPIDPSCERLTAVFAKMKACLTYPAALQYPVSTSVVAGTRPFNGTIDTSPTLEYPPEYPDIEHPASTTIYISPSSLNCEPSETTDGIEMDRRRDISSLSMSVALQESSLVYNTSSEKGPSVIPIEAQSSRQGQARRAEDGGIRIAGGPPGRQMEEWRGSRCGSEVASSTGSTLPPAYNSDIS